MRRMLLALAAIALALACTVEVHVYDETSDPQTGEAGAP
jgi:hypothetical protein